MRTTLTAPRGALAEIAQVFGAEPVCEVAIREDRAFGENRFFSLGQIKLCPQENHPEHFFSAVRQGAFEWRTPELSVATRDLYVCLGVGTDGKKPHKHGSAQVKYGAAKDKVRRILDSFGAIPARLGLSHPIFDPRAIEAMPFRRPTTIVSDTSGVLQGGLSFVSRHLCPAARVTVPAIVQTEIVNFADRFLSNLRASNVKRVDLMMDHLNSQAGQRVLLQLELNSDIELERTFLLGDPLRGAFQRERDPGLAELNLSVAMRSYVDRLILEAARQHEARVAVGHPVTLLTSDQGLARMALAEGVQPLYFRSASGRAFFGRCFSGANLSPFSGGLYTVSVADVLWELATISGSTRLSSADGARGLTIRALGENLAWAPYQSRDDLLWMEALGGSSTMSDGSEAAAAASSGAADAGGLAHSRDAKADETSSARVQQLRKAEKRPKFSLHRFNLGRLMAVVDRLELAQELPVSAVMETLGARTVRAMKDYRLFLVSGGVIGVDGDIWSARSGLTPIAIALRNADAEDVRTAFRAFPSYQALEEMMAEQAVGRTLATAGLGRAARTFQALAEVTVLGAQVHGTGFFATPTRPTDEAFAEFALSAYDRLEGEGGWVATGRWLEELVMAEGVHPIVARRCLQIASERGLVERTTEGSTTQTEFDRHTLRVLDLRDGVPSVRIEYLYRGDFLIPGKSSSSLRIETVQ